MISEHDLQSALRNIEYLEPAHKARVLQLLKERERTSTLAAAQQNFLPFVKTVWPQFIPGAHHTIMADAFDRVIAGTCKRLAINMAPRHTKSEFASVLLPAYALGRSPRKKIIQVSTTEALASGFGRRVRNMIDGGADFSDPEEDESKEPVELLSYKDIFPKVRLAADSKAAAGWHTNYGGEYFAIGINGRVTGKGADLAIVDDPHDEQQARQAETSPEIFDGVYSWYTSGIRQRLQPNGAIILVMCMTGDTDVLMADGSTVKLRDIRRDDWVATYDDGEIGTSRIANYQSSGVDAIYTVRTQSGRTVRANERHPFLVDTAGERTWVRLRDLKPGMSFVAAKAANDPLDPRPNQTYARPANLENPGEKSTLTQQRTLWDTTGNGKALCANGAGTHPFTLKECASYATDGSTPHQNPRLKRTEPVGSKIVTALRKLITTSYSKLRAGNAQFAFSSPAARIPAPIGTGSSVSITTTSPVKFGGFSATTATSPSAMERPQPSCDRPLSTYSVTTDQIVSIDFAGYEEVFDVEVERTENFIANGIVSHNTRWSERDLTGRVIEKMIQRGDDDGDTWEVIELPALLDEGEPTERPMWPGFWSLKELRDTRAEIGTVKFQAQYQQKPTASEGAILKREYWKAWGKDTETDRQANKSSCPGPQHASAWRNLEPPACDYIITSWDTAQKKTERADYSAMTTWGIFKAEDPATGKTIANAVLLSAFKARMDFPELKKKVKQFYNEDQPDTLLIEDKGSGISLIQELRSTGVPVENFSYGRGGKGLSNDKVARANMVSDIFASGYVWAPERRFADEVITECAQFPRGVHDDYVDSVVQAMLRFRTGGFIRTANDEDDDEDEPRRRYMRKRFY